MTALTLTSLLTLMMTCQTVWGHGMMLDPPQRSSMWRYKELFPDSPENYNDNQLFCGGYAKLWDTNKGICGVCGDDYSDPEPRENEAGGKYATGVIVKTYQRGDVINVTVRVTANHLGYFIFKICPNNDVNKIVTHECLDQNVVKVVGPEGQDLGDKFYIDPEIGEKHVLLQLPADMTCTQCVLQWRYNTGNSWGCNNPDHTDCCIGCGEQENFVNCADIAIEGNGGDPAPPTDTPEGSTTPTVTTPTTTTTTTPATTTGSVTENCNCRPAGAYADQENMIFWCCHNCAHGYCPETHCACS